MSKVLMLKKTSDGRMFPYTETLAARPDMVQVMVNPENHNDYDFVSKTGGSDEVSQLKTTILNLDKQLVTEKGLNEQLTKQVQNLENRNNQLMRELAEFKTDKSDGDGDEGSTHPAVSQVAGKTRSEVESILKTMKDRAEIEQFAKSLNPAFDPDGRQTPAKMKESIIAHMEANGLLLAA